MSENTSVETILKLIFCKLEEGRDKNKAQL